MSEGIWELLNQIEETLHFERRPMKLTHISIALKVMSVYLQDIDKESYERCKKLEKKATNLTR